MRSTLCAVLLAFAGGCGAELPAQDGQSLALSLVWTDTLHADFPPPLVEWRQDLCPGSAADKSAVVYQGTCYSGLYLRDDRALIAWRGRFSSSAFAHELVHAWQWSRGIDDPLHERTPDWTLATTAEASLADAGL